MERKNKKTDPTVVESVVWFKTDFRKLLQKSLASMPSEAVLYKFRLLSRLP